MATVSGQGTTFNLPNYTGELFTIAPRDTPLLSAIGGLQGGESCASVEFEWQVEGLEATSANNARTEGANAPTASEVDRSNISNVVEIHQEAVEVSYTKQASRNLSGVNFEGEPGNPVRDELAHQIDLKLAKIAVDVEKSFLNGVYAKPGTNAAPRTTRGVLAAITTNVFANGGTGRAITKSIVDNSLAGMFANGSPLSTDTTVLMVGAAQKIALSNLYGTGQLSAPVASHTVGGIAVDTVITDFGTFGVMLNRYMPAGQIGIVDLGVLKARILEIPDKGFLFVEPLAKTGSADKYQIYGEIGLQYGPETYHGLIKDLL